MRAFVHVHEVADAVSGAVAVVAVCLPHRRAADGIQQRRGDAVREDGLCERDVRLEDEGVVVFLCGARCADGDDAGDVGGSVLVLAAGVDEEQAVAGDAAVVFFAGAVVRQGGVGVVTGDGAEAGADVVRLLAAVFFEERVDVEFGQRFARRQFGFEFGEEAAEGGTVGDHRVAGVRQLSAVFAGFVEEGGVDGFHQGNARRQVGEGADGGFRRIEQQVAVQAGKGGTNGFVGRGGDVGGGEDGGRGGVEFLFVEVEGGAMRVYQQEGEKYGVVGDVAAAQVGQPGDVVQAGDEVVFRAVFLHGGADAREFGGGWLADVRRVVRVDGRLRQRRAVLPELVDEVALCMQGDVFRGEGGFELALGGE